MRISNICLKKDGDYQELSALLGSQRLWYRIRSDHLVNVRADAFVIAGLFLAMSSGEDIQVDSSCPISPQLCGGIRHLQRIYSTWNPKLRPVTISASMAPASKAASSGACFFSGGIDGIHTFLRHRDEIQALVFIRGIDFTLDNERLFREAVASNARFAASYGKTLLTVETNIREFSVPHTRIGLTAYYGPILASVASLLAFEQTYLAAGLTYVEIGPELNLPFTWPLWSTEECKYICDGAEFTRLDKISFLATHPGVLDELRICLANTEYNCNRCDKCLINRAMLRALGLKAKSLSPLDDCKELESIRIADIEGLTFCRQTFQAAEAARDSRLANILRKKLLQYQTRQAFWQLDRYLLNGRIRRRWRRSRQAAWKGSGVPPWECLDFKHIDE